MSLYEDESLTQCKQLWSLVVVGSVFMLYVWLIFFKMWPYFTSCGHKNGAILCC